MMAVNIVPLFQHGEFLAGPIAVGLEKDRCCWRGPG
jgi:hypothetical protein